MLQRTEKNTAESNAEFKSTVVQQTTADLEKSTGSESLTFYTDSTDHSYSVQLWPKGSFNFSAANGFEGAADKVSITGRIKGMKKGSGLTSTAEKVSAHAQSNLQSSQGEKSGTSSLVKKSGPSAWWLIGGLLLLAGVLLLFLKLKF